MQRSMVLTIICLAWRSYEILVYKIGPILQTVGAVASLPLCVQMLGFQIPELEPKYESPPDISRHPQIDAADSLPEVPPPAIFLARFPAERPSSGSANVTKVTAFVFLASQFSVSFPCVGWKREATGCS